MLDKIKAWREALFGAPTAPTKTVESGSHDTVKVTFINWTATMVPFMLGILLAISNGYFFAGFRDFSFTDIGVFIAWGSGFAIEAVTLAAIFDSAIKLHNGNRRGFRTSLVVGLVLALISFTAQYVYLQMSMMNGSLPVNDTAVDKMPLFSLLIGVGGFKGHDVLFLVRSSAYHLAEFACTFLMAKNSPTHEKLLADERKAFEVSLSRQNQSMVIASMQNMAAGLENMAKAQEKFMNQQFVALVESMQKPTPRVEVSEAPQLPASVIRQLLEAVKSDEAKEVTARLNAEEVAAALEERAKKAKALWTVQAQPVSQQTQGPEA